MNPVDHPHGGGEGKQGRGRRRSGFYVGQAHGQGRKSRRPKKYSNVFFGYKTQGWEEEIKSARRHKVF